MNLFLGIFVLASLGYAVAVRLPGLQDDPRLDWLARAYVGLTAILLSLGIAWYTAVLPGQAPDVLRRIAYVGVEASLDGESRVALTGDKRTVAEGRAAFVWSALGADGTVRIEPTPAGESVRRYRLSATGGTVVRANQTSINAPATGWLGVGVSETFGRGDDAIRFEVGDDRVGVTFRGQTFSPELKKQGTLDYLLARAGADAALRRSLAEVRDTEGRTLADASLVRQTRGKSSPVGLIGFWFGEAVPTAAVELDVAEGRRITLQAGDRSLLLPGSVRDGRLALRWDPPLRFALPSRSAISPQTPDAGKEDAISVLLASFDPDRPEPGYVFATGNAGDPVLAEGKFSLTALTLKMNGAPVPTNREIPLGNGRVRPLMRFEDAAVQHAGEWVYAVIGLALGAVLLLVALREPSMPEFRGMVLAHHAVLALLTVRAILAFRVSILPPGDLSAAASASYADAWRQALVMLIGFSVISGGAACVMQRYRTAGNATRRRRTLPGQVIQAVAPHRLALVRVFALAGGCLGLAHRVIPRFVPSQMLLLGVLLVALSLGVSALVAEDEPATGSDTTPRPEPASATDGPSGDGPSNDGPSNDGPSGDGPSGDGPSGDGPRTRTGREPSWADPIRRFLTDRPYFLAAALLAFADLALFLYTVPFLVAVTLVAPLRRIARAEVQRPENDAPMARWYRWQRGLRGPRVGGPLLGGNSRWWEPFRAARIVTVAVLVVAMLSLPLLTAPLGQFAAARAKGGAQETFIQRLIVGRPEIATALLNGSATANVNYRPEKIVESMQQRWQMVTYARSHGVGYFRLPVEDHGIKYPIFLTDAAYSTLLLGEHGRFAGWLVIGLHVLAGLGLLLAAAPLYRRSRPETALMLVGVGLAFGLLGLYMAAANLWWVPFTGQNVPLLGISSLFDALLFLGLAMYAWAAALYGPFRVARMDDDPPFAHALVGVPAALLSGGWLALGVGLLTLPKGGLEPFNLAPPVYDAVERTMLAANRERTGDAPIALTATEAVRTAPRYVAYLAEKYERGELSRTPIVPTSPGSTAVSVDRSRMMRMSPLAPAPELAWRGAFVGQGATSALQLLVSGASEPFTLQRAAPVATLRDDRPFAANRGQRIEFWFNQMNFGGIELNGAVPTLRWDDVGRSHEVRVNGQRPESDPKRGRNRPLRPFDLISIVPRTGQRGASRSVLYVGTGGTEIAQAAWRNGAWRRRFPYAADFPLAFALAQAADSAKVSEAKVPMSLQIGLQRDLQSALRAYVTTDAQRRAGDRLRFTSADVDSQGAYRAPRGSAEKTRFIALTVVDSFTGAIEAAAALPQADPNEPIERHIARFRTPTDAAVASQSSWTLSARSTGSAAKPITFGALATALNNASFDISKLVVQEGWQNAGDRYVALGAYRLRPGVKRASGDTAVTMSRYLSASRTWPAVVTATLGLSPSTEKTRPAWLVPGAGQLAYAGQPYRLAFPPSPADDQVAGALFANDIRPVPDGQLRMAATALDDRPLFRGMKAAYRPFVQFFDETDLTYPPELRDAYLPFTVSDAGTNAVLFALPAPHRAESTLLTQFDTQFARYAIGGGEFKWNAVIMAAMAARLTTGRAVMPTWRADAAPVKETIPGPIGNDAWRRAHLETPLLNSTTMSGIAAIRGQLRAKGYSLWLKTGTIDDGAGQESEIVFFTIGRRNARGFMPGSTLSGYATIRAARSAGLAMVKDDFVRAVLPSLVRRLDAKSAALKKGGAQEGQGVG
ncbi:MAG: hypothetical protein SFX74_09740 [Fimbriimonadaceae bacterium]|nr:hypothetical protein [Fimbriimonadaceae bacterium]